MRSVDVLKRTEDRLARLSVALPARFTFAWRGRPVTVRCDSDEAAGTPRLTAIADLGPLPFTSEAPEQRARLLTLLNWSMRHGGRIAVRRGRLTLTLCRDFDGPLRADAILKEAVLLLIEGRPLARLVEEVRAGALAA